ncbi:MAG: MarP family serine protease [Actinomycetota bacterium]|nr:MarP family serine protease [Actinomycetota bacterium]
MNVLDALIAVLALMAAAGGYQMGFLLRVGSWGGALGGLIIGTLLVAPAVSAFGGTDPLTSLLVAIGVVLGAAMLGQAIGYTIGAGLLRWVPHGPARQVDRGAGAIAGIVGVGALVWLLTPALADVPGAVAQMTRTSTLLTALDEVAPPPPDHVRALRNLVGKTPFPEVFSGLRPAPEVGPPPDTIPMPAGVQQQVAQSAVAVEAQACRRLQEGSGFVAAGDTVVTNAHVIAGAGTVQILRNDGARLPATVVAFDSGRDLAVLRVPGLGRPALPISAAATGADGAVFGYPLGQDQLRMAPMVIRQQLTAVGRDIYGQSQVRRQVYVLSAALRQGDSGAAVVRSDGAVVAVAFAIAPDRPQTAYALTDQELRAVLPAGPQAVSTGPCL